MNNLIRHIEILLLEHDCVIVPGLGGFIANTVPARYVDSEALFLPPYRTIAFNQSLSLSDGLLVQSYMQAFDAGYPEASLQLEKEVNAFRYQLFTKGNIELGTMGTLSVDINGLITLKAHEAGILTPSLYGLYSIAQKTVEQLLREKNTPHAQEPAETEPEKPKKKKKISMKKIFDNVVDISVAAAVAAIMFFLLISPSSNTETNNREDTCIAGSLFVQGDLEVKPAAPPAVKPTPQAITPTPPAVNPDSPTVNSDSSNISTPQENAPSKANSEQPNPNNQKVNTAAYTIVLASCVSRTNSQLFIANLSKKGLTDARFIPGKTPRIVYGTYRTESEAYENIRLLRQTNTEFQEAWVMKIQ